MDDTAPPPSAPRIQAWKLRDCGHPASSVEDASYACPYCTDYEEAFAQDVMDELTPWLPTP